MARACQKLNLPLSLLAVNHWPVAVETHAANHPEARHLCADLDSVNPREAHEGDVDILVASPECTHFSVARGGAPINDQSRATAWCVARWAEAKRPKVIILENVQELQKWGPLGSDGKPIKSKQGKVFLAWVGCLEALGYRVEWRVLRAADHSDPTTRRRLFIVAVKGRRKIIWPEPTHADPSEISKMDLFQRNLKPWVTAREIIDWSIPGKSIFNRKRPLAENTTRRIMIGLQRFGLGAFIVPQQRGGEPVKGVDVPLPTVTTTGTGMGLAQPFLVNMRGKSNAADINKPVPTVTAGDGKAGGRQLAVCKPYLVAIDHQGGGGTSAQPADAPLSTVTSKQRHAVCQPFLVPNFGERPGQSPRTHSVDEPLPAVTSHGAGGLVQPFLVEFYGQGKSASVDDPLHTVPTRDRFGLVMPIVEIDGQQYKVDIHFRMLTWKELARAQGFPNDYLFTGTGAEIVKQIGNAVPVGLAEAMCSAAIQMLHSNKR